MKISEIVPGHPFNAIQLAHYVRDNKVSYNRLPDFYGGVFCKIEIVDARYQHEFIIVVDRSLRSFCL